MARYFGGYFAPVTSYVDAYFGPSSGGIIPTVMSLLARSALLANATYTSTLSGTVLRSTLVPSLPYTSSLS